MPDFLIYLLWMIGFLIATFWILDKLYPSPPPLPKHMRPIRTRITNDRECIELFIYVTIILIVAHIIFNMFVSFQFPPRPGFGDSPAMQTTNNGQTYEVANSVMYIHIPFTGIKLYGPENITYYPDRSQISHYYDTGYTVLSSDNVPMSVSLMWNLNREWPHTLTDEDKQRIFYKRGPNWEANYATAIVTQEFAQRIASRFPSGSLQLGSPPIDDICMLKVSTDDFGGHITINYEIIDETTKDCFYERLSNSVYSYQSGPDITYGEPGEEPYIKPDKCNPEPTHTPDSFNRVTLNQ